jgi:hypothetical protein
MEGLFAGELNLLRFGRDKRLAEASIHDSLAGYLHNPFPRYCPCTGVI